MNLHTSTESEADLAFIVDGLERKRAGYGFQLLSDYDIAVANIERFPQMYALVEDAPPGMEIRNAILERFNVRVIYRLRETDAVVVAVWDARRRPGTWRYRLSEDL